MFKKGKEIIILFTFRMVNANSTQLPSALLIMVSLISLHKASQIWLTPLPPLAQSRLPSMPAKIHSNSTARVSTTRNTAAQLSWTMVWPLSVMDRKEPTRIITLSRTVGEQGTVLDCLFEVQIKLNLFILAGETRDTFLCQEIRKTTAVLPLLPVIQLFKCSAMLVIFVLNDSNFNNQKSNVFIL